MGSEQLFTMQLLIQYLLLLGSARLGGTRTSLWRIGMAAAIGAAYAVGVILPQATLLRQPGVMAVVLATMFWLAFGSRVSAVRQAFCYLMISLALCGAVVGVAALIGSDTTIARGTFLYPVSFRAMVLMAGLAYLVCRAATVHAGSEPAIQRAELSLEGRRVRLPALVDTGNQLRDPLTGKAVMVADWDTARELLPPAATPLLTKEAFANPASLLPKLREQCPQLRVFFVPYRAVGGSGILLAVRCDRVSINAREIQGGLVAFSPNLLDETGHYRALTGGKLI